MLDNSYWRGVMLSMVSIGALEPITRLQERVTLMSKADLVYKRLRSAIIRHRLAPGTRLPAPRIAQALNVSRTPVNQALERLSSEGLVELERHTGARVVNPTTKDVREIFVVHKNLEGLTAELAAKHITPEQLEMMKRHIEEEQRAFERRDTEQLLLSAGRFHRVIAEASDNHLLMNIVRRLIDQSHACLVLYELVAEPPQSPPEHRRIVEALQVGPQSAREAMESHIESTLSLLDMDMYRLVSTNLTDALQSM